MSRTRKEQVYAALVKEFVEQHDRVPTQEELHRLTGGEFYKPLTKPMVPKYKAKNRVEHFRRTMKGLLDDTEDVVELSEGARDANQQLDISIESRAADVADSARNAVTRIRHQELLHNSKTAITNVLPEPVDHLSAHIRYGSNVTLLPDSLAQVSYTSSVLPVSDRSIERYQLGEFSLPYSADVRAAEGAAYSGFILELTPTEKGPIVVTRIYYDGSPIQLKIEVTGEDGQWKHITTANPLGRSEYAINKSTSRVKLTLTQAGRRSRIHIRDLQIFQEQYKTAGVYVSGPYDLKGTSGHLRLTPNQYIPEGTSVDWSYGADRALAGRYVDSDGQIVHPNSPLFDGATYNTAVSDGYLYYSEVVPYDDLAGSFASPSWRNIGGGGILFNATRESENNSSLYDLGGTLVQQIPPIYHIATLSSKTLEESIELTYGRDSWIFRTSDAPVVAVDQDGVQTEISTPFPHWMTHILVKDQYFDLVVNNTPHPTIDDQYAIKQVILQKYPTGQVIILGGEDGTQMTTRLSKGTWKCSLIYNLPEDGAVLLGSWTFMGFTYMWRATQTTNIDPIQAVPTNDTNGNDIEFMIQPIPITNVGMENLQNTPPGVSIDRFAITTQGDGQKKIFVPGVYTNGMTDLVTAATGNAGWSFPEDLYSTSERMAGFYDISYIREVDDPVDKVFISARIKTEDPSISPIIRGVTVSVK